MKPKQVCGLVWWNMLRMCWYRLCAPCWGKTTAWFCGFQMNVASCHKANMLNGLRHDQYPDSPCSSQGSVWCAAQTSPSHGGPCPPYYLQDLQLTLPQFQACSWFHALIAQTVSRCHQQTVRQVAIILYIFKRLNLLLLVFHKNLSSTGICLWNTE